MARVAFPFLKDTWLSYNHMGSVPEMGCGSAVPEPNQKGSGAHVSVKRTSWVVDTGSGHDLVPQHVVDSSYLSVAPPGTALSLSTANGPIAVESVAQIRGAALNSI